MTTTLVKPPVAVTGRGPLAARPRGTAPPHLREDLPRRRRPLPAHGRPAPRLLGAPRRLVAPNAFEQEPPSTPNLGGQPLGPLGGISADHLARRRTPSTGPATLFAPRRVPAPRSSLPHRPDRPPRIVVVRRARPPGSRAGYFRRGAPTTVPVPALNGPHHVLPVPHLHDRDDVGGQGTSNRILLMDRRDRPCFGLARHRPRRTRPDPLAQNTASNVDAAPAVRRLRTLAHPDPRHLSCPGVAGPVIAYTTLNRPPA